VDKVYTLNKFYGAVSSAQTLLLKLAWDRLANRLGGVELIKHSEEAIKHIHRASQQGAFIKKLDKWASCRLVL